jgi:stage V sporulation protein D (sporulation-specific penicillin-binding protein)
MIRMVSTIANKGILMEPRLVKQIIDTKTGEVENIEPKEQSRAISENTAKQVLSMMESVVTDGTGRNAQVKGYSIGGKTGTSEDGVNTNKYVTSFVRSGTNFRSTSRNINCSI